MTLDILKLAKSWARHDSVVAWRYTFNLAPTLSYRMGRPCLSAEQKRVVSDLRENGIAVTSAAALGIDTLYEEVRSDAEHRLANHRPGAWTGAEKSFTDSLLGETSVVLDSRLPHGRLALDPSIRAVANAYLGMYTQLRFYNLWRTRVCSGAAQSSQLWHRDREDFLILKAFIYLRDVYSGGGPFRYVPGTHRIGPIRQQPEWFLESGVARATDNAVEAVVPRSGWVEATGPAGTIVFADTAGIHAGGLCTERERLLWTCMYTSRDSQAKDWFQRPHDLMTPNAEVAFAASYGRKSSGWVRPRTSK